MKYQIKDVAIGKELPATAQRPMLQAYAIRLEDAEGRPYDADVLQKPSTPAPLVGDFVEGTLEKTEYGLKFRKDFVGHSEPRKPTAKHIADPHRERAIQRQSARRDAIGYVHVMALAGRLPEDFNRDQLAKLIDWMDEQI